MNIFFLVWVSQLLGRGAGVKPVGTKSLKLYGPFWSLFLVPRMSIQPLKFINCQCGSPNLVAVGPTFINHVSLVVPSGETLL